MNSFLVFTKEETKFFKYFLNYQKHQGLIGAQIDWIANKFGITRRGAQKRLAKAKRYGLVERHRIGQRMWITEVTEKGKELFENYSPFKPSSSSQSSPQNKIENEPCTLYIEKKEERTLEERNSHSNNSLKKQTASPTCFVPDQRSVSEIEHRKQEMIRKISPDIDHIAKAKLQAATPMACIRCLIGLQQQIDKGVVPRHTSKWIMASIANEWIPQEKIFNELERLRKKDPYGITSTAYYAIFEGIGFITCYDSIKDLQEMYEKFMMKRE